MLENKLSILNIRGGFMVCRKSLVSIIMPTFNCTDYISRAIKSVIDQTWTNWELIIVDDGSTDNTTKVIDPFLKYHNIVYLKQENKGIASARNKGIKYAHGDYIAFLDSDDIWNKFKLEKQIGFMLSKNVSFSCTGYSIKNTNQKEITEKLVFPPKKISYKKCLLMGNVIGNLTAIYNCKVLGKIFVPEIRKRNDFALWLKILKKTNYCYGLQETLASYTIRKKSISRNKAGLFKFQWQLYRKIENFSVIFSAAILFCNLVFKFKKMVFLKLFRKEFF